MRRLPRLGANSAPRPLHVELLPKERVHSSIVAGWDEAVDAADAFGVAVPGALQSVVEELSMTRIMRHMRAELVRHKYAESTMRSYLGTG